MGSTLLLLALITQPEPQQSGFLDTLQRAFGLRTDTRYVLLVDASGDPQMRSRWADVRKGLSAVAASLLPASPVDVITFEASPAIAYSGPAGRLTLDAFPERPTGKHTDWGRALELIYQHSEGKPGLAIVFTLSICCVKGIDEPSPESSYASVASVAWDTLEARGRANTRLFFVPVRIEGSTFTYPESVLARVAGKERVLTTTVSLADIAYQIGAVQRKVVRELLHKALDAELAVGTVGVLYTLKGDRRQRLFLTNNYRFLSLIPERIDSIAGKWLKLSLNPEHHSAFTTLVLTPTDTIGPIEKPGVKGPRRQRWAFSWRPGGIWIRADTVDTLRAYGKFRFVGATEINSLGLDTLPATPTGVVRVKRINLPLLGGGIAILLIGLIGLAWRKGRPTNSKVTKPGLTQRSLSR